MNLKTLKDIFLYLTNGYRYELEDVLAKNGIQRRLKNPELANMLENKIKENLEFDNIMVSLKLGPIYNRASSPWIMLSTFENRSGTRGRYCGISFNSSSQEVSTWLGYRTDRKKSLSAYPRIKRI